jgi:hypothetical protein
MPRKYVKRDTTQLTKTKRKCRDRFERGCVQVLESNRFFDCETCVPELDSDDGDLIYHDWDIGTNEEQGEL